MVRSSTTKDRTMHAMLRILPCMLVTLALAPSAYASETRHLNPDGMPRTNGYSHVVEVTRPGRTLFLSGQLGINAQGVLAPDFRAETTQAFENIKTALAASGASFKDVVRITIYLTNMDAQLGTFREVRNRYIDMANPPASSAVEVKRLTLPTANVEIEVTAALPENR